MPKLRNREALAASKHERNRSEGQEEKVPNYRWSKEEMKSIFSVIKQYGTASIEKLNAAVPLRSEHQVKLRIRQLRRDAVAERRPQPIDCWLERIMNALPTTPVTGRGGRPDLSALVLPLTLAADEERREAAENNRHDLSDVYEYLTYMIDGKVPPAPNWQTARILLALMHHLSALMRNVDLSPHRGWLWSTGRLRQLRSQWLGGAEGKGPPRAGLASVDLSQVPAELRRTLEGLMTPELNSLHVPPAFLLSPLAARLDESAADGDQLDLLMNPNTDQLRMGREAPGRPGSSSAGKGDSAAFGSPPASRAGKSPPKPSSSKTADQLRLGPAPTAKTPASQCIVQHKTYSKKSPTKTSASKTVPAGTSTGTDRSSDRTPLSETSAGASSAEPGGRRVRPAGPRSPLEGEPRAGDLSPEPGRGDARDAGPPTKTRRLDGPSTSGPRSVANTSTAARPSSGRPDTPVTAEGGAPDPDDPSPAADGPSGAGTGPSGADIGPSGAAIGPSGVNAGPSGVNTGPSGVNTGPSGANGAPPQVASGLWGVADDPSSAADAPAPPPGPVRPPPSLEGARPGPMTEADRRTEPPFAVGGRGVIRTYSRKRRLGPQ